MSSPHCGKIPEGENAERFAVFNQKAAITSHRSAFGTYFRFLVELPQ
jgi:hypothetical protein